MVTSKKKRASKKRTTKRTKRVQADVLQRKDVSAATAVNATQPSARAKVRLWSHLSEYVLRARVGGNPVSANDGLRVYLDQDPDGILAPALLLWMGDNFKLAARFQEAVDTYAQIVERFSERVSITGRPWPAHGLEQMAICYERLGDWPAAVAAYQRIVEGFPLGTSPAELQYRIGRAEEEAGRYREAIAAYRSAEQSTLQPGLPPDEYPELGRRAAERLERPSRGVPSIHTLSESIACALRERDINALAEMASPTHFGVGVTHLGFVPFESIAEALQRDLANSRIAVDPTALEGTSTKLTLRTDGWQGEVFKGQILFVFTSSRGGWEWVGMALTELGTGFDPVNIPGEAARRQDDDDDPDTEPPIHRHPPGGSGNTGDVFWLKAPWPKDICFRAGGINRYALSKAPFIGGFIVAWDTFSCCGYGPYGFYYDQGTTHHDIDKFAIDFVRYQQGVPLLNLALSTQALAAHPGVVTNVVDGHSFGDRSMANRVELDWLTKAETQNFVKMGGTVNGKFRTKYLHLDKGLFVSLMMLIPQGARLGFMDHTGNSAWPHLHFSLHDRDALFNGTQYASIPPHPLDGHPMLSDNDGDCLKSTNVPFP